MGVKRGFKVKPTQTYRIIFHYLEIKNIILYKYRSILKLLKCRMHNKGHANFLVLNMNKKMPIPNCPSNQYFKSNSIIFIIEMDIQTFYK